MGKSLVIVESPSKAKIINKYLGSDYVVKASVGHVRDLPVSSPDRKSADKEEKSRNKYGKLGLDPQHHWDADYQIMPDKVKVIQELKKLAKDADKIYLATDLDREGEAIAWHLKEVLCEGSKNKDDDRYLRVKYPEITKSAIQKAFAHPERINMDLVNAQQTRRFLDRVVGFMLSPLLWKKVSRGLSAGRVQSVAVKLIVEREREIKAHRPEESWTVDAQAGTRDGRKLDLEVTHKGGKKYTIPNEQAAIDVENTLKNNEIKIQSVESKKGSTRPFPPFTTSTLQQSANRILGFSVKRTMNAAQRLYESGFITYMRTDSVNLSQEAIAQAREMIEKMGKDYLPDSPNYYKAKETAQEAHEAIRPSYADLLPEKLPDLGADASRLYRLIHQRYLACQMTPSLYETTTVTAGCGDLQLKATGRVVLFDGFRKVYPSSEKDIKTLDKFQNGEVLDLGKIDKQQHFSPPPHRYSEASLVGELEKDGIGRPSTYAAIISTIQDRGYVTMESGRFYATKMGEIVTDRLEHSFQYLMDTHFTASMEENLDEIATGKVNWEESLDGFYRRFEESLEKAEKKQDEGGMPENKQIAIDMMCPQCHKYKMSVHSGKTGNFLSCLGYYDKNVPAKERCHKTMNLKPVGLATSKNLTEEQEAEILRHKKRCPKCDSIMDEFLISETQKLYLCAKSPGCEGYILEEGDYSASIEKGPEIECEKCGSKMVLKEGRFGKYMSCTNEKCKNTRKILKNGEIAPPTEDPVDLPELQCDQHKNSHYVLREGAAGIFLAAHDFPKVRETRAPYVSELKRFRDRISPKFYYLADAPAEDDKGNPTVVRFSRKTKKQYIMSINGDKAAGYTAFYDEASKSWRPSDEKKGKSSARKGRAK